MTMNESIGDFIERRNEEKFLFTAGPASLLEENLSGLAPCFGRGDAQYAAEEQEVLSALLLMTGHQNIVRMQGAASLALEIMAINFLYGRVLIISTGYYSDRLYQLAKSAMKNIGAIKVLDVIDWTAIDALAGRYDWIFCCYTETSRGIKFPIEIARRLANQVGAKLMIDATASIGLEGNHELADVIAYSSCKGLFGLTGAAFIAYNEPSRVEINSFYLSLATHIEKKVTGPYHAIQSLAGVLRRHSEIKGSVLENKKRAERIFARYLEIPRQYQPNLCTYLTCKISSLKEGAILYYPRGNLEGSIICHLGEAHLGTSARGDILNILQVV